MTLLNAGYAMKNVPALALASLFLLNVSCSQPTQCRASCQPFYADVELLDWEATLNKAALSIAGRLPDSFEREMVRSRGQQGLEDVLDQMMKEEPFYDRLKEIYNDFLLTDRYIIDGTTILDDERYPNRQFYETLAEDGEDGQRVATEYGANFGVGREPLNIIAHVVRQDRNFGEILTGNYTLVNAYSAQSYGLFNVTFVGNPFDRNNLVEVSLTNHRHAGLLTTPSFLNRFPTTDTNRNRHRSRYIYNFFLDVDVLQLGTRPLATSNISGDTPTMTDAACVSCHATIDPLAGTMQSWDDMGRWAPDEDWYDDMFPPGFNGEAFIPDGKRDGAQWIAERIVKQPGFVRAAVKTAYKGLIGSDPITIPKEGVMDTPEGNAHLAAYDAQSAIFNEIGNRFKESNMNFKVIVKNLILSPFFRATNIKEGAPPERELEYASLGMGRFLTPEMLNRKVKTMLALDRYWGEPGRLEPNQYLLSNDQYLIYYGGIDSNTTTTRITAPNGISLNVGRRMANQLACNAVALDLSQPVDGRALFPNVNVGTLPENADDETIEEGPNAGNIRRNIAYLHNRFLGENVGPEHSEVSRTMQLFLETLREGRAALAAGEESKELANECRGSRDHWTEKDVKNGIEDDPDYTVRAWMSVVSYLMADYKFLHE